MSSRNTIAFTPGDPAGVGLDLAVALASCPPDCDVVIICDQNLFESRVTQLNIDLAQTDADSEVQILDVQCPIPAVAGKPNPENSMYVLETLNLAITGCQSGQYDAMVTGPVNKEVISKGGFKFSGHTEYLAERTNTQTPVMLLASSKLRVALATTHLPLSKVAAAITKDRLRTIIEVLHRDLQHRFQIKSPRIAVCGLNPHAGDGGLLGNEELETIIPVIADCSSQGMHVFGPLPADTAFTPSKLRDCDVVLAMYHDQGLPVIKHSDFGAIANITLGLPIIRTSVDHGTAYDVAGTSKVDRSSMMAAFFAAIKLCRNKSEAKR